MQIKTIIGSYVFLPFFLFFLLLGVETVTLAQIQLDDPTRLAISQKVGIEKIKKTSDSTRIWIGSRPSFNAFLVFPLEPEFDPQKNNILEITMRTGPRIHDFRLFWKQIGGIESSVGQGIYRDGEFHTYLISLQSQPTWSSSIVALALGWNGTRELIEIKRMEVRTMGLRDRIRYYWSRFWVPETLKSATINAIGGPVLVDQPLALLLSGIFVILLPFIYFRHHRSSWKMVGPSVAAPLHPSQTWFHTAFWILLTLWVVYDLRESYNHAQILESEFRYYFNTTDRQRTYLELDNLYDFLGYVKSVVPPSSEMGFYNGGLLFVKARYFLFPRRVYERASNLDYIAIFQDPNVSYQDGMLMEKGKAISGRLKLVGRFDEDAFILEKSNE